MVQTVAFSAYLNTERNNAFNAARQVLYKTEGEKMGFNVLERDSIRKLSNEERATYYEEFRKVTTSGSPKIETLKKQIPPVNVEDFVDHIDYMVNLIGIDHVGISSDFDGGGGIDGWNDASETLNVTVEMVKRGYSEEEIAKLWGGNLLRVLDEVEAVAKELQKI